jgi:hypothetical protein
LRARERFVSAEPTQDLPRGDFLDSLAEGGIRFERDSHAAEFFVAFERRNDVYVELPGVRDRALVGIRFLYGAPVTPRAP